MIDIIILLILVVILGSAVTYIVRAKKQGAKCIGCPDSKSCGQCCSKCNGSCHTNE